MLSAAIRAGNLAEGRDGFQLVYPVAIGGSTTNVALGSIYALQLTHGIGESGNAVVRVGICRLAVVSIG